MSGSPVAGLAGGVAVLGFTSMGDALREALDSTVDGVR
jgi:hypothetical protein